MTQHDRKREDKRLIVHYLRAYMAVEPRKVQVFCLMDRLRRRDQFLGHKPEFGVKRPSGDVFVCVRVDSGGDAQRDVGCRSQPCGGRIDDRYLRRGVDDDAVYAILDGQLYLIRCLHAAMADDPVCRETCGQSSEKLAPADCIQPDAAVLDDTAHGLVGKCFSGVVYGYVQSH